MKVKLIYIRLLNRMKKMKTIKTIIACIFILITFNACNEASTYKEMDETFYSPEMEAVADQSAETPEEVQDIVERKLITNGNISFETNSIATTRKQIYEAVKSTKAYVTADNTYKNEGSISNTMMIRVPSDNFDLLLSQSIKGVEKIDNKEINVKDVTEEFLDISARIKTKKELENRYLEILKSASKVSEILEIEREIGQLRAEIESIEGRLKYLQNQVSYSTLTIQFYQNIDAEKGFGKHFKNGFKNGWDNLIWFFIGLINVWPFVLLIILFAMLLIRWRRRRNLK